MTTRHNRAAALLMLLFPVLAFPAVLGSGAEWVAASLGVVALVCAVGLVKEFGRLAWYVGVLALTALVGWVRTADQLETVNHFCGLALGLLAMGTVAAWCRTHGRLALGVFVFLLCGVTALGVGSRSTTPVHAGKALFGVTTSTREPATPLPLSGLHSHTSANRNALAATAMMVLPVAVAVALTRARWLATPITLRLAGFLSAAGATAVVVVMQSRSAWLSAAFVLWLWARRWMRARSWWLVGAMVFLAAPAALVLMWGDHPQGLDAIAAAQGRLGIWKQALQALRPSPWVGIGLDYFRHSGYSPVIVWPDLITGTVHAHNIFLQTALDVGLVGLASYVAVIAFVMRRAWDSVTRRGGDEWIRAVAAGAALSVVSVHVYGLFDAVPLGTKVGIFQWLACGLILAAWRLQTDPEAAEERT